MPSNSYDVIVIGDELPGLVAATLCARRGMRVLIARTRKRRSSYQLGPFTLPAQALPFIGYGSPAMSRVIDELHFDHALKRKLLQHTPSYQLVCPGARLDIGPDDERLEKELARELDAVESGMTAAQEAIRISAFVDGVLSQDATFPPSGFWERREVGRSEAGADAEAAAWFEQATESALVRAFVEAPAVASTRQSPLSLGPIAHARALAQWRQGAPRLAGDLATLEDLFLDKLANHSGEVREARIAALTFSWGRVSGVRLESDEELGAEHVIAAMPVHELARLAGPKQSKRLTQCVDKISIGGYRYTLNLVIGEAGVPAGMAPTVLMVSDLEAPLIGDNALAIYRGEPDQEARVVLTIQATCPAPEGDEPGRLAGTMADLRVRIRERIEEVMPFVSDHILLAHSPNEDVPAEGVEGALELTEPLPPSPLWTSTLDSHLGVSAVPYDVGIKRLTVASTQVLPGLGLEGELATGWSAAKIATAAAGKKRELPKDELLAAKR
jgi:hypothetical protein